VLSNSHVGEVVLLLQNIQELQNGRVGASYHGMESVVPPFNQVRGSESVQEDVDVVVSLGVIKQRTAIFGDKVLGGEVWSRNFPLQVLLDYVDVGFSNLGFVVVIRSRRDEVVVLVEGDPCFTSSRKKGTSVVGVPIFLLILAEEAFVDDVSPITSHIQSSFSLMDRVLQKRSRPST